jgi:hypothetical protein
MASGRGPDPRGSRGGPRVLRAVTEASPCRRAAPNRNGACRVVPAHAAGVVQAARQVAALARSCRDHSGGRSPTRSPRIGHAGDRSSRIARGFSIPASSAREPPAPFRCPLVSRVSQRRPHCLPQHARREHPLTTACLQHTLRPFGTPQSGGSLRSVASPPTGKESKNRPRGARRGTGRRSAG